MMNTPNVQTVMPGDHYLGPDPFRTMSSARFVAPLEDFARRNALSIETGTAVTFAAEPKNVRFGAVTA